MSNVDELVEKSPPCKFTWSEWYQKHICEACGETSKAFCPNVPMAEKRRRLAELEDK